MANLRKKKLLKEFGERLKACRIAAQYNSAGEFAADIGLEAAAYRKYERGQAIPQIDNLAIIMKKLQKSADFLLFGLRD